VGNRPV